jgi:hypothetical protein
VVNGQGVSAIRDGAELRDRGIVLLQLVLSIDDRKRDGMVLLARDEQERATRGVPGVDPVFRPGVEVGRSVLEDERTRPGDRVRVVELVGFVLIDGIGKAARRSGQRLGGSWRDCAGRVRRT